MSDSCDALFQDGAVPLDLLRQRAFNLRWAEQPAGVIPLTAADPDFPAAPVIRQALVDHAGSGVFSYGPPGGLPGFREAVAGYLRLRGACTTAAGVIAVNSAAAGLAMLARHWLAPGDEAIVPDPVDFLFAHSVRLAGGVPVLWRIDPLAPLDLEALEARVTGRTRLLCLCNPHNPLGRCFRRDELEAIGRFCLERGIRVLSDEIWSEVIYPPATFTSWLSLEPELARNGAVVHGFSKSFALAGLRVGYVAMAEEDAAARLLQESELPSTVDGVSTLSQVAAQAAYSTEGLAWLGAFLRHLQARRDQAVTRLREIPGLAVHAPDATYVLFVGLPAMAESAEDLTERLRREHGVAVVPGSPRWFGPGARGHVRLCFATSAGLLEEGLQPLRGRSRGRHASGRVIPAGGSAGRPVVGHVHHRAAIGGDQQLRLHRGRASGEFPARGSSQEAEAVAAGVATDQAGIPRRRDGGDHAGRWRVHPRPPVESDGVGAGQADGAGRGRRSPLKITSFTSRPSGSMRISLSLVGMRLTCSHAGAPPTKRKR